MPIPQQQDLMLPAFRALGGRKEVKLADVRKHVAMKEQLTDDDVQKKRLNNPNRSIFRDRLSNALNELRKAGLVKSIPSKGWRLTEEGEKLWAESPKRITYKFLRERYPHYAHISRQDQSADVEDDGQQDANEIDLSPNVYSVDNIFEGCFLSRNEIDRLLDRLRMKGNLILQGSPGTGKTWIAKRLAFALIGKRDNSKIRAVQFHPNLSYEDFVRGWRPDSDGKIRITDGVFLEAVDIAKEDKSCPFVVVIEEINRGNPIQIFGELLTLLERDKRTEDEALELVYPDSEGEKNRSIFPRIFM